MRKKNVGGWGEGLLGIWWRSTWLAVLQLLLLPFHPSIQKERMEPFTLWTRLENPAYHLIYCVE